MALDSGEKAVPLFQQAPPDCLPHVSQSYPLQEMEEKVPALTGLTRPMFARS